MERGGAWEGGERYSREEKFVEGGGGEAEKRRENGYARFRSDVVKILEIRM